MKLFFNVLARVGLNAVALLLTSRIIDGFQVSSDWLDLLQVGFWLGIANYFLKPILKLISLPLIILSLGLFTLLINTAMLLLVDYYSSSLTILGFLPALKAVFILGFLNFFFSKIFLKN